MGGIDLGRVILGGLLAGPVINIGETILNVLVLALGFAFPLGIGTVGLHAAIRPRLGPGATTAVAAALFVRVFLPRLGHGSDGDLPGQRRRDRRRVGLVEIVFASTAGAWLYTE